MKTGIILFSHIADESAVSVTEWYAEQLRIRGHRDVNTLYHDGDPSASEILQRMNVHGMNNTFIVIPMLVSEGNLTTWILPKELGMPDNSCSYTYLTGTHIAIRFTTALGCSDIFSEILLDRLRDAGAEKDDGIVMISKGSELSMSAETMERHASYLNRNGFPNVETAMLNHGGPSVATAVHKLLEKDVKRIVVLPMFLFEGRSVTETIPSLVRDSALITPIRYAKCIGKDEKLLKEMENRIPNGW